MKPKPQTALIVAAADEERRWIEHWKTSLREGVAALDVGREIEVYARYAERQSSVAA